MNLAKIQSEIISEVYKRRIKGDKAVLFDEMAGTPYVGVITSPYYAYVFPKADFLLNTAEMRPTRILSDLYDSEECASPLQWNGKTRQLSKDTAIELESEKGKLILLNVKFVKKFGKPDDLYFKSKNLGGPVFVYNWINEFLLGIIMPITPSKV